MGNKRKSTMQMTPATIILNVVMVAIIIVICVFAYKFAVDSKTTESDTTSKTTTTASDEATTPTSVSMTKATTTTTPPPETSPEEITDASGAEDTTPENTESTSSGEYQDILPSKFDEAFFADDLFIGDSITTGLYLYGILDMKNVAAAQGLSPTKALSSTVEVDGGSSMTVTDYAAQLQPKRIYIMLGSNGISPYTSNSAMIADLGTLVAGLKEKCPDSVIYFLTVTPITKDSTSAARNEVTNELISEYNKLLKEYCDANGYTLLDLYDLLLDSNGYFRTDYAEQDGMHFLGKTYKVLLSFIQTSLS